VKPFLRVSASQIDKHQTCNRRWWFPYVYGLPHEPQAESAALGEAVHAGQEKYLTMEVPDGGVVHTLAKSTLPLLADLRDKGVKAEHQMARTIRDGREFIGKIDVFAPPLVIDWKTGNPDFFKTAEDLVADTQMMAYAYEVLCTTPSPTVTLAHVGIPTKTTRSGAKGGYVEVTVPAAHVHQQWTRIQDYVDVMARDAAKTSPLDVKPNTAACMKFGRACPYLSNCSALKTVQTNPYADDVGAPPAKEDNMPAPARSFVRKMFPNPATWAAATKAMYDAATPDGLGPDGKPDGSVAGSAPVGGVAGATVATVTALTPAKNQILPPEVTQAKAVVVVETPTVAVVQTQPVSPKLEDVKPSIEPLDVIPEGSDAVVFLFSRGFTEEQVNSFPDEDFNQLAELAAKGYAVADLEWDEVESAEAPSGKDYLRPRPRQVPVPEPVVVTPAAPARRSRTAAPATAAETPAPVVEPTPEPVVVAEPAKRRGRPPGSTNKPKVEEPVVQTIAPVEPVQTAPEFDHVAELEKALAEMTERSDDLSRLLAEAQEHMGDEGAPAPRLVLYVDCLPEKGVAFRHLDDLLAPLMAKVAKEHLNEKTKAPEPLSHYSLVPFNGGPARVAAHLLTNPGVVTGAVVVSTASPCAGACLEVLRPVADVVVRGVR
jgi:hypothetical protein